MQHKRFNRQSLRKEICVIISRVYVFKADSLICYKVADPKITNWDVPVAPSAHDAFRVRDGALIVDMDHRRALLGISKIFEYPTAENDC